MNNSGFLSPSRLATGIAGPLTVPDFTTFEAMIAPMSPRLDDGRTALVIMGGWVAPFCPEPGRQPPTSMTSTSGGGGGGEGGGWHPADTVPDVAQSETTISQVLHSFFFTSPFVRTVFLHTTCMVVAILTGPTVPWIVTNAPRELHLPWIF